MNFDYKENGGKKKLFLRIQSINIVYPNERKVFMVPNYEKNEDYYENPSLSSWMDNFDSKENDGAKRFLANPKHHCHLSQWGDCVFGA